MVMLGQELPMKRVPYVSVTHRVTLVRFSGAAFHWPIPSERFGHKNGVGVVYTLLTVSS